MSIWTNCYTCHKALIVGTPCPNCETPQLSPSAPLRARVLKALWAALVANDTVDAMAAFVQSERQQAAEEAYERAAQLAVAIQRRNLQAADSAELAGRSTVASHRISDAETCAEILREIRALKLTGGA